MGGYTKLPDLPHVLFYTPLAYVVWTKLRRCFARLAPTHRMGHV